MPLEPTLTNLASSVGRRIAKRWRPDVVDQGPAPVPESAPRAPVKDSFTEEVDAYIRSLIHVSQSDGSSEYLAHIIQHAHRFASSLRWIPDNPGRILDPAAGGNSLFPKLLRHFRHVDIESPAAFFDLEKEPAPYPDGAFDGVVLMEVLEHFTVDPMYAMCEINRVLKPGGFLFLTTPNIASWVSMTNLIKWNTPYVYGLFERKPTPDRHNREYTVVEVERLCRAAGFRAERLEALNAYPVHDEVPHIPGIDPYNRGDTSFILARKEGPVTDRYPDWLYNN